ncbi:MAG: hypothetical protein H7Z43_15030, partial [Clostridia bacterium]|nr:hypothetical protein [Deltaproteobacteria bacterium]
GYSSESVGGIPNWTTTKRFLVIDGLLSELDDLGELNMGDPKNLSDFIAWGLSAYPADNLALVLWDHGSGWVGFAADMSASYDGLTQAELKTGIADGLEQAGRDRFTVVGFDACLMGSLETALVLRDHAEYLLGSEELEPGHGWDYTAFSGARDDPAQDVITLADAIVTGFRGQALVEGTSATITLAMIDLYALKAVERALIAVQGMYASGTIAAAFGRARGDTREFGREPTAQSSANMVDLADVMVAIADATQADEPRKVAEAVHHVIMTQTRGSATSAANGLSVYWPPAVLYDQEYATIPGIDAWRDLLAMIVLVDTGGSSGLAFVSGTAAAISQSAYVRFSGQLVEGTSANVTDEGMYYGFTVGGETYVLGDSFGQLTSSGQVIADWNRNVMIVSQGATRDFAYYSYQPGDNGTTVATMPFGYAASSTAPIDTALLVAIYNASGGLVQQMLYLSTAAGYGQLTPASGSQLFPVYGHMTSTGLEFLASETLLNPQQPLNFTFETLSTSAVNRNAFVLLYAQDYAGHSANASWMGKL